MNDDWPPATLLLTRTSLKILNLGFRLDKAWWLDPQYHWPVTHYKFKIKDLAWTWKDDWPPLSLTRISLKILNLNFSLGHGKMIVPPIIFTNQNLTENLNLRLRLDMERWLTPIVTDQNVTENLKLKIWLWNGMMINPPLLPTRISLKVLYFMNDDCPPHCCWPQSHWKS